MQQSLIEAMLSCLMHFKILILCFTGTYAEARKKESKAAKGEELSSTDQEALGRSKRKKRVNSKYVERPSSLDLGTQQLRNFSKSSDADSSDDHDLLSSPAQPLDDSSTTSSSNESDDRDLEDPPGPLVAPKSLRLFSGMLCIFKNLRHRKLNNIICIS